MLVYDYDNDRISMLMTIITENILLQVYKYNSYMHWFTNISENILITIYAIQHFKSFEILSSHEPVFKRFISNLFQVNYELAQLYVDFSHVSFSGYIYKLWHGWNRRTH